MGAPLYLAARDISSSLTSGNGTGLGGGIRPKVPVDDAPYPHSSFPIAIMLAGNTHLSLLPPDTLSASAHDQRMHFFLPSHRSPVGWHRIESSGEERFLVWFSVYYSVTKERSCYSTVAMLLTVILAMAG